MMCVGVFFNFVTSQCMCNQIECQETMRSTENLVRNEITVSYPCYFPFFLFLLKLKSYIYCICWITLKLIKHNNFHRVHRWRRNMTKLQPADEQERREWRNNKLHSPCQSPEKVQLCCNHHLIHSYF